ncbi:MAG TPA: AMP-binding protein, partial [Acidocella sp.]|nr:AMP-binding protein [Acidocella sp.]
MGNFPSASRLWLQALEAVSFIERDSALTLGGVLNDLANRYGTAVALIDDEETLSYRGLAERANRYANWARAEGLAPGATIALLMRNCADYVAIWAGLSQAGCTVALINTNLGQGALAHAIRTASAAALIVETELQDNIAPLLPELPPLRIWRHGAGESAWPRADLAAAAASAARPPPLQEAYGTPALLIYTSGTTGLPKAANVSHARILQWSYWFAGLMNTQASDRLYNCLPMYHSTGGVSAIGAMLVNGGSVYIRRRFS